jgi:DNA-binding response OmpR family regulator
MGPLDEKPSDGRTILLIDDDTELCSLMTDFFSQHEFQLEAAHDGRRGLARALEGKFDLILLDVMLPVLDGFALLQQIRKRSNVPVIMLTARTEQGDRIEGLEKGADDYLPKPFGPEELLARIRAVLRRTGNAVADRSSLVRVGELLLNAATRDVWLQESEVNLTSTEFDILEFLARSAGRVVSREELTAMLYQREATPYERALDVHVSHLRKKLEPCNRVAIRSIRGVGYLLSAAPVPVG